VIRRLCLITGASAGIGAEFARVYAAHGYDLALTARRVERLEALAASLAAEFGVEALALPADLADPAAPSQLIEQIAARGRVVDALVNNAGYGLRGTVARLAWAEQQASLQVMVTAVAELSRLVLPGMLERGFGRIVNVSSLLGLMPALPGSGLYSAAKAFVVKLSETLHLETQGSGVHVTALCPGLTHTEFHDKAVMKELVSSSPAWIWQSAEAVARAGYAAVEANRPICVPGATNKAFAAFARAVPESWGVRLMAAQARRHL